MKQRFAPLLVLFSFLLLPGLAFAGEDPVTENSAEDPTIAQQQQDTTDQQEDDEEANREVVVEQTTESSTTNSGPSWTWIIGRNALAGGFTGALIGLGIYLITDRDTD